MQPGRAKKQKLNPSSLEEISPEQPTGAQPANLVCDSGENSSLTEQAAETLLSTKNLYF